MAIKKPDLFGANWNSCDELRVGKDASLHKDYVLELRGGSPRQVGRPERLDHVCQVPDGTLEVIDFKTGRPVSARDGIARDLQVVFYRTLAADAYRYLAPTAIHVTFVYLDGIVPVAATLERDEFLERWAEVEEVVMAIRRDRRYHERDLPLEEAFPLERTDHCRTCPMRRHCAGIAPVHPPNIVPFPGQGGVL